MEGKKETEESKKKLFVIERRRDKSEERKIGEKERGGDASPLGPFLLRE